MCAYNVMPQNVMVGCKALTERDAWLGLTSYNDKTFIGKCAWQIEQHNLLDSANWHGLRHIKKCQRSQPKAG